MAPERREAPGKDGMLSFEEAIAEVLRRARPLSTETLPVISALGRSLAGDVRTRTPIPRFDKSAMDGYALRSQDTISASKGKPLLLPLQGGLKAGECSSRLKARHAAKINTGAMLPRGADAILVREEAQEIAGFLKVPKPVSAGDHVRPRGGEFDRGAVVLRAGAVVTPPLCGLLAELGRERVRVHRLPRVAILVTGDELRPAGAALAPGQIFDANSPALVAALRSMGIHPVSAARAPDRRQPLLDAARKGLRASDVLVVAGGVSVGDYDLVKDAFASLGVRTRFWGVAVKPGKPLFFGILGRRLIFGLPGNPVSALVAFHCFVKPALAQMMGREASSPMLLRALLLQAVRRAPGRMELLRGKLSAGPEGELLVTPTQGQESHMLGGLAGADCLIHIPGEAAALSAGDDVLVSLLRWGFP